MLLPQLNGVIKRKREEGMNWPGRRTFQIRWRHFFGMMGRVVRLLPNAHVPHRASNIVCLWTKLGVVETSTLALEIWEPFDFQVPSVPGWHWSRVIETFRPSPQDILEPGREQPITGDGSRVEGRSIVVLMSQKPSTHMDAGGAHPSG
jgi:hypothetical protein